MDNTGMMKAITHVVTLLIAIAVVCRADEPEPATGIQGVIRVSPVHGGPVRQGEPDSKPLQDTKFVVKQANVTVASFKTDREGRFRVSLAPGHYSVTKDGWAGGVGRYGPFEVDVTAGQMKLVEWQCDSGMR